MSDVFRNRPLKSGLPKREYSPRRKARSILGDVHIALASLERSATATEILAILREVYRDEGRDEPTSREVFRALLELAASGAVVAGLTHGGPALYRLRTP